MSDPTNYIVSFVVGAAVGFLPLWIMSDLQERKAKTVAKADLIAELRQNRRHESASTYISLEDEAFKRFRALGLLDEEKEEVQDELRQLYSYIHEKNELLASWRMNLSTGKDLYVTGGEKPETITSVVARLTKEIEESITGLLPVLTEK